MVYFRFGQCNKEYIDKLGFAYDEIDIFGVTTLLTYKEVLYKFCFYLDVITKYYNKMIYDKR
jgi:hypothetical protein